MTRSSRKSFSRGRRLSKSARAIRLLIADDSLMDCQLLKNALTRSRPKFHVAGCVVSQSELKRYMSPQKVDVALISESLQDGPLTGFQMLREVRASFPKMRVIMILKTARHDLIVDAFRAGAKGVFCRAEPVQSLCKCVQVVHQGQIWANSQQVQYVLDAFVAASPLHVVDSQRRVLLTKREEDVAKLVSEGRTNRAIAQELGLTEHTVSNYLFRIYEKVGISSRVELVLYWFGKREPYEFSRSAFPQSKRLLTSLSEPGRQAGLA